GSQSPKSRPRRRPPNSRWRTHNHGTRGLMPALGWRRSHSAEKALRLLRLHHALASRMVGLRPQSLRNFERIDFVLFPPSGFIRPQMQFAVMDPTEWHGELVAHFAAERARLGEAKMVCIRRTAPTDEARFRGDECPMVFVTFAL